MRYELFKFCPAALRYTFHLGEGQGENGRKYGTFSASLFCTMFYR